MPALIEGKDETHNNGGESGEEGHHEENTFLDPLTL